MKCIMLINIKMSTVGILTFMSIINTFYESLKAKSTYFSAFSFYWQLKFNAQLSKAKKKFNNLWAGSYFKLKGNELIGPHLKVNNRAWKSYSVQ